MNEEKRAFFPFANQEFYHHLYTDKKGKGESYKRECVCV